MSSTRTLASLALRLAPLSPLLIAMAAQAQSEAIPEIVVSANRVQQDPKRLGVSYDVIDAAEIERQQQVDLRRVLQDTPGVFVSEIGARGSATSITIRGNRHQDTLLRVDGAKLSGGIIEGFSPYLAYAGTYNIERIEVIPGAQSIIYGSDTIGGAISVYTRRGEGPLSLDANVEAGSFRSLRGGLQGEGSTDGGLAYSFHVARDVSDNERDYNHVATNSYSLRLDYPLADNLEIGVAIRGHNGSYQEPGSTEPSGSPSDIEGNGLSTVIYLDHTVSERWNQRVQLSYGLEDYNGYFTGFEYLSDAKNYHLDWQNTLSLGSDWDAIAGVVVEYLRGKDNFFPNGWESATNTGAYFQTLWEPDGGWSVTAGARFDDYELAGNAATWRVTAAYLFEESQTKVRGAIGTAFRAPSLYRIYTTFRNIGNPQLDPETSLGIEIGVDRYLRNDSIVLSATYFDNDIEDLITTIGTFPNTTTVNRDEAETSGLELALRANLASDLNLQMAYTHTDSTYTDRTGLVSLTERRDYIPKHHLAVSVDRTFGGSVTLGAGLNYAVDRTGTYTLTGQQDLEDFSLVRLYGQFRFGDNLVVNARVENLLDEEYDSTAGFPGTGAAGYVGVTYSF